VEKCKQDLTISIRIDANSKLTFVTILRRDWLWNNNTTCPRIIDLNTRHVTEFKFYANSTMMRSNLMHTKIRLIMATVIFIVTSYFTHP